MSRQQVFNRASSTYEAPFGGWISMQLWLSQANGTDQQCRIRPSPTVQPKGHGRQFAALQISAPTAAGSYGDPKKLHGFEFAGRGRVSERRGAATWRSTLSPRISAASATTIEHAYVQHRLWAEYNYASGDTHAGDGSTETFQNLFPTNHKFYGYMDLFSWQNLHNPEISLRVAPMKNVTAELDFHGFWLASTDDSWYRSNGLTTVRPISPNASNFVGTELDFVLNWNVNRRLSLQMGYCHFFAGDYLADTGASDGANFGYFMATVNL